jgi:hypothetical protein
VIRSTAALTLLLVGTFAAATTGPGVAVAAPSSRQVVVIGAPDLTWGSVSAADPSLWALLPPASLGSLSVKAADPISCPDDGWLTLGAGNRVTAGDQHGGSCSDPLAVSQQGLGADVPGVPAVATHNAHLDDGTKVGALATALHAAGSCIAAAGPGAALAAADPAGHVATYLADSLAAASDHAFLAACPVTMLAGTQGDVGNLAAAVQSTDPGADILVIGISESGTQHAHLHVAVATGPDFGAGRLISASTRRAPFVQLVDVAPTVLALRGISAASSMIGEPWRTAGAASEQNTARRVARLADLDLAAQQQAGAIVPFYLALVVMMLAAGSWGWIASRRRAGPVPRRLAGLLCVASALVPAASFTANLVPWWRADHPLAELAAATAVGVATGTAVVAALDALVWRRRSLGPVGGVGLVTAAVIGIDLLTGGRLQIFTMAGYSPLVAGRFAGIGNVAYGIFAAGALLAIAALAQRAGSPRAAIGVVAVLGAVAVALDGGPSWGSDVGGVLALVPTLVLLSGWVSGVRVSWRRAFIAVVSAVAVVVLLGLVDYARPADHQTHLGRFVGKVLHGGAWTVLRRKALADVRLLTHSPVTLLIPLLVIAAIVVIARPQGLLKGTFESEPVLRAALAAVLVMSLIGAVVNDSGVVIPALAVLVVLPASIAAVLRATPLVDP